MMRISPPSQRYQVLIDRLSEGDLQDESSDLTSPDRVRIMQLAESYAGKLRFAAAKQEMRRTKAMGSATLTDQVVKHARALLELIANNEQNFGQKYSVAFRNGKDIPDSEVLDILRQLQEHGLDLTALARDLEK